MNGDEKRIVMVAIVMAFLCGSLLTYTLPLIEPLFHVERVADSSTQLSEVGTQNHINQIRVYTVNFNRGD